MRITWIQPEDLLRHELVQSGAEGKQIEDVAARWRDAGGLLDVPERGASPIAATSEQRSLARALLDELDRRPARASDDEPDDLDAIRATWPEPPALPTRTRAQLDDRVRGAWFGRAIGCLLGKPVEGVGRAGIRAILDAQGRWPLADYFTARGLPDDIAQRHPWNRASRTTSLAENIDGMPEDDDLNYTLLALSLVERRGSDFTTADVAEAWLAELPALRVFTAERAAYRNLLDAVDPAEAAARHNPYREWIGAQIRADLYGWISPGDPHAAAARAWHDARLSHTRNGVYGAMYAAALASAALVADDVDAVLDAGLAAVPPRSRLAEAVRGARDLAKRGLAYDAAVDALYERYGGYHWVHVLPNAAAVTYALASSGGDFSRAICGAVAAGWDTDSNGATVGAVAGALTGARALPQCWPRPLRGRLSTSLRGFDGARFSDLADRTLALIAWL